MQGAARRAAVFGRTNREIFMPRARDGNCHMDRVKLEVAWQESSLKRSCFYGYVYWRGENSGTDDEYMSLAVVKRYTQTSFLLVELVKTGKHPFL